MNNTFDSSRLGLVIRKHWLDNRNFWLSASAVVFLGLGVIFWLNQRNNDYHYIEKDSRIGLLFGVTLILAPIFANNFWKDFSQKGTTISFLTLPASALEKFLAAIFYCCIVFPVVMLSIFYAVDFISLQLADPLPIEYIKNGEGKLIEFFKEPSAPVLATLISIAFNILVLLGHLYFERLSLLKTIGITMLVIGLFIMFDVYFPHLLIGEYKVYGPGLLGGRLQIEGVGGENGYSRNIRFSDNYDTYIGYLTLVLPTLIATLVTYIRLREKEV
jgi:hypothetical protein